MKSRLLYTLIVVLVILHLGLLVPAVRNPSHFQTRDSQDYLDLARTFLSTGRYAGTIYPGVDLMRPPVYPILVAIGLLLGQGQAGVISILQVILFLATAWLIYSIWNQCGLRNV